MRGRGETRAASAWKRAGRRLGRDAPATIIDPVLRSLCMEGDKALTVISRQGILHATLGTPLDPEDFVAWREDAVSVFFHGVLPRVLALRLGSAGVVEATASSWSEV